MIGGGPAGVSAALQGAELGAQVTLVERKRVGGTSVNEGPAPVRTLARAARLVRDARSWETFGLRGSAPEVDVKAAVANAVRVADYSHDVKRMSEYIASCGVELVQGVGQCWFVDPHTIETPDGQRYSGDAIIIAVGGHAGRLPIPGAELALTYEDIRSLDELPVSTVVIGGSDTGCQLASILVDFGSQVTVLEYAERIKPRSDHDVSDALAAAFTAKGMRIVTGTQATEIERSGEVFLVHHLVDGVRQTVAADLVFFAVGWPGNADTLRPEAIGLQTARGYVTVDDRLVSSVPHILAAGDATGLSMLVPSARQQGLVAAENAVLGTRRRNTHEIVPTGSFTDPEYGSVGLTEQEARARYDCEVAIVRYDDLLRPVVDARSGGFCKLIVEPTGATSWARTCSASTRPRSSRWWPPVWPPTCASSSWPICSSPSLRSPRRWAWPRRSACVNWVSPAWPSSGASCGRRRPTPTPQRSGPTPGRDLFAMYRSARCRRMTQ